MNAPDGNDDLAVRFAPYLDEFHDFYRGRGVRFGTVDLLMPFADRLRNDAVFREEMTSLLRSVIYREKQALASPQVAWFLSATIAGSWSSEGGHELLPAKQEIRGFSIGVVRALRSHVPSELADGTTSTESQAEPGLTAETPDVVDTTVRVKPDHRVSPNSSTFTSEFAAEIPEESRTNDRLARAIFQTSHPADETKFAREEHPEQEDVPIRPQIGAASSLIRPKRGATESGLASFFRRSYWLPGVCALLFALAVVVLLAKPGPPYPAQTVQPAQAAPHTDVLKSDLPPARAAIIPQAPGLPPKQPLPETRSSEKDVTGRNTDPDEVSADQPEPSEDGLDTITPAPTAASTLDSPPENPHQSVFLSSSGIMTSRLLFAPVPGYPKIASLTRVEGQVVLQATIARNGKVSATRVLEGPSLLRGAAEHAVREWRYQPYTVNGEPTEVATLITMSFRLDR